jgi:iron complex outermembrane receptor protein
MQTSTNPTTFSAGWEYDWRPDFMVYTNVNSGFKPGGISSESIPNYYYEPETQMTYAAGIKSRLFGNKLQLNVEAFLTDDKDMQLDITTFSAMVYTAGNGTTYTQALSQTKHIVNIGRTLLKGLTVDYDWLLTGKDRLNGNIEFKDNKYGELLCHMGVNAMPPGCPEWIDYTGRQMPFSPKFTFYGSYSHLFTFSNYTLTPRVDIRYSTKYYAFSETQWELAGAAIIQPAFFKYDGYLNFGPASGTWQLNAYCKNIFNEAVLNLGMMMTSIEAPRTIGVGITARF